MNLEQLNCLIAVVEEGSISAGARRLNLTQPPVSLQLQRLEAQCGVRLLERGGRKIRLTEAGKSLYDTAKRIQTLTLAAQEDMKNFQLGKKGSLHLGMISSGAGERFSGVPGISPRSTRRFPSSCTKGTPTSCWTPWKRKRWIWP